jgi:hypothetical protein
MSVNSFVEEQESPKASVGDQRPRGARSLVLVVGSGRSGTSLFTGIMQRLGFYVPQPEVPADETNPRGFAESQWVVDFHTRLLHKCNVRVSDARPAAWGLVAQAVVDDEVGRELREWLAEQFDESSDVIVKDPRLSWFVPLWCRCAEELQVSPRFVMMLRHPAAVIDSKQRWYGGWQGDVGHTAAWLNASLYAERATRKGPRGLVRYDDLLEDWTKAVGRLGEGLDLRVIRDAPAPAIVRVHEFVDHSLSRSRPSWEGIDLPAALREQADGVWDLLGEVADADGPLPDSLIERLDAARAAYADLYGEAEAIAQSSIDAARRHRGRSRPPMTRPVATARRVLPAGVRRRIPLGWKKTVYRMLSRTGLPSGSRS